MRKQNIIYSLNIFDGVIVRQCIKEMAEADDRSFSQYINMILKEHVAVSADEESKTNK